MEGQIHDRGVHGQRGFIGVFRDASRPSGRCPAFFFEYKERIADHFAVLFDSQGGNGGEFAEKWGWYPILYDLAGENILAMDSVTKLSVGHVFTHLAFLKDLNFKRKNDNV